MQTKLLKLIWILVEWCYANAPYENSCKWASIYRFFQGIGWVGSHEWLRFDLEKSKVKNEKDGENKAIVPFSKTILPSVRRNHLNEEATCLEGG